MSYPMSFQEKLELFSSTTLEPNTLKTCITQVSSSNDWHILKQETNLSQTYVFASRRKLIREYFSETFVRSRNQYGLLSNRLIEMVCCFTDAFPRFSCKNSHSRLNSLYWSNKSRQREGTSLVSSANGVILIQGKTCTLLRQLHRTLFLQG